MSVQFSKEYQYIIKEVSNLSIEDRIELARYIANTSYRGFLFEDKGVGLKINLALIEDEALVKSIINFIDNRKS